MTDHSGEQQETYSLREWLGRLSRRFGLRDSKIKEKLGQGLARLLEVDSKTTPAEATERAIVFFGELLDGLEDSNDRLAGRVTLNTPDWPETRDKILAGRREWITSISRTDTWSGSVNREAKPTLPDSTMRDHMRDIVFPYLEDAILARWQQKFLDEPFPLEPRPENGKPSARSADAQPKAAQVDHSPYVSPL